MTRPSFPVEILTEIFKLALGYTTEPSSPFKSPLSSAKDAASLLLASKRFRALALPLAYRSIIIARPRDFVTFFGVDRGVFNVGYDLEQKKAALKEICVVQETAFPFDPLARVSSAVREIEWEGRESGVDPLEVYRAKIECLTILSLPVSEAKIVEALGEDEVTKVIDNPRLLLLLEQKLQDINFFRSIPRDDPDSVVEGLRRQIREACVREQLRGLVRFLQQVQPSTIRLWPRWNARSYLLPRQVYTIPTRIVAYQATATEREERTTTAPRPLSPDYKDVLASVFSARVLETAEVEDARIRALRVV